MPDDVLVDHLELGAAAGPVDPPGVEDLVTDGEPGHAWADGGDHPRGVVAEDAEPVRVGVGPGLDVGRVDRDGLDPHQQLVVAGRGHRHLGVDQALRVIDRQRLAITDRVHEIAHQLTVAPGGAAPRCVSRMPLAGRRRIASVAGPSERNRP
ncbi:hypothetical protein Afe04nite_57780 [Asanoa ferruginea]|nr:hypothetical protein Afe04nite_57780 [Asanoa ferruginea]